MSKRELSEPEKFFIENHYLTMSAEEIAKEMNAKGVWRENSPGVH